MNELYMRAVEPKPGDKPKMSLEDLKRGNALSRTYVKLMWKRDRVMNRDLHRKIMLKWAAIHALPSEELRREALVVDPYVPLDLRMPLFTPPLAGFHGAEEREKERRAAAAAEKAAMEAAAANVMSEGAASMQRKSNAAASSKGVRRDRARGSGAGEIDLAAMFGAAPVDRAPGAPGPKGKGGACEEAGAGGANGKR